MKQTTIDITSELVQDTNRCAQCHNRTGLGSDCRRHAAAPGPKESK